MNVSPMRGWVSLAVLVLASCKDDAAPVQAPPPLPVPTAVAVHAENESALPAGTTTSPVSPPTPAKASDPSQRASQVNARTKAEARPPARPAAERATAAARPAPAPTAVPAAVPLAPAAPVPSSIPAAKPVVAAKRVIVPRTEHVHVELPAALQGDLDADPRMQTWVERVIAIADGCHADNRSARGAIEARITMHENERPDADIGALPAQLSGVVACATGALMRTKMPLFTGREGARYAVRIVFE